MFQYQKGAIKTALHELTLSYLRSFQYQKGAIKTRVFDLQGRRDDVFQYQKGAIKTRHLFQALIIDHPGFNTKKVRLKRLDVSAADWLHRRFNTKKVRLKQYFWQAVHYAGILVSIPKRCD